MGETVGELEGNERKTGPVKTGNIREDEIRSKEEGEAEKRLESWKIDSKEELEDGSTCCIKR